LVTSLSHPGGNITGVNLFVTEMEGKRLGLLRRFIPTADLIAVLINPANPPAAIQLREVQEAARTLSQQIHILHASGTDELDAAFSTALKLGAGAMIVCADPFFNGQRDRIIDWPRATDFRQSTSSASMRSPGG
jgi:putative ABC transport system substrate-binding protein